MNFTYFGIIRVTDPTGNVVFCGFLLGEVSLGLVRKEV